MIIKPAEIYGATVPALGLTLAVSGTRLPLLGLIKADKTGIEFVHSGEAPLVMRHKITRLAHALLALPDQRDLPVEHEFADGMYIRRMFIPKGTVLVGKIHKKACVNMVEKGDIAILTETGAKRVKAGFTIVSPPGLQKVGYANEDTVFTNIFRTDVSDPEKVEEELIWESYEAMEQQLPNEGGKSCQSVG
ncbi:hypothetical protein SAMN06265795_12646 [Noviherbaspirillum humi]|uniref:Uncharacterized protein n=1 Tax=Noviherbaspirillum humi TaxID=1688639 RepID=A0A239LUW1_9BURK|nr:hypothetical protein [Noviherbaspirillum humi]SNT33752.1 hypothetical protein SAMN06265795_12646 [Noviherbaspirillum humi]